MLDIRQWMRYIKKGLSLSTESTPLISAAARNLCTVVEKTLKSLSEVFVNCLEFYAFLGLFFNPLKNFSDL